MAGAKGGGTIRRCTPQKRCPLCGKPDYCMSVDYGEGGTVLWCARTQNQGSVSAGGAVYDFITHKAIDIGEFNLYMESSERERIKEREKAEWIEEQKRTNPNWGQYKSKRREAFGGKQSATPKPETVVLKPVSEEPKGVPALSNKELDERYRYLLSLLVLEEKHRTILLKEWKSDVYPDLGEDLLARWPIRSLPPADKVRYGEKFSEPTGQKLRNKSRKAIVKAMVDKFGDLTGVPGLYQRTGKYWEEKPELERWTIVENEGIIFPTYDKDGYLYRLRIREDYHNMDLKESAEAFFEGKAGTFYHKYSPEGEHLWYFAPKDDSEAVLVSGQGVSRVALKDGRPNLGKPSGKYKTLSSNGYEGGTASGSPISLFYPEGCKTSRIVIFTEGEKKSMVTSYIKRCPVVSFPGVGAFRDMFTKDEAGMSLFDTLVERGMQMFVLCYDADKENNRDVHNAEEKCIALVKEKGLKVLVGEWSGKFDKGLDDILLMGVDINLRPR